MVEELSRDYADYFKNVELTKEINPINTSIEEMLTRLEEFESLLTSVRADSKTINQSTIPQMLIFSQNLDTICNRIDKLEKFVGVVNENLAVLEKTVEIAEKDLHIADNSLKSFLKPLFSSSRDTKGLQTNLENGEFKPPKIFNTKDYFLNSK